MNALLIEANHSTALRRALVGHEFREPGFKKSVSLAFLPFELPSSDLQIAISEAYHSKSFEVYAAKTAPAPGNLNQAPAPGDLSVNSAEFAVDCSARDASGVDAFFDFTVADLADCSCEIADLALGYDFELQAQNGF